MSFRQVTEVGRGFMSSVYRRKHRPFIPKTRHDGAKHRRKTPNSIDIEDTGTVNTETTNLLHQGLRRNNLPASENGVNTTVNIDIQEKGS